MESEARTRDKTKEDVCNIHKTLFLEKVQQSSEAIQNGDFDKAIRLYTEAISLDPINHILYSNRSAAFIKICQFQKALKDAVKARQLNPKWSKAYFREGIALQCLGRHGDSLAAFAAGLAQDPKNTQLLSGMVEAAVKSPLKARLEPLYQQLQKMKLDKSPFVIIAVIGQELLSAGAFAQSVKLLESALRIGTCSMKLRGSVFSALSSSHWGMGNMDKAIACMQQDLGIAKSLGDQEGECRVHGNLGSAFFSKGNYKEALSNHRQQLVLAMRLKERQTAVSALSSLGHVYTAIGDYPNALASHKQCVLLVRQMKHKLQEARETGNVGAVYLAMGDFDRAVECHNEHMKIAKQLKDSAEEARAYSNLGSAYHYKRNFETAIEFHKKVLNVAEELSDKTLEARAYAGLGHASRCIGDMNMAKKFHEKQLDNALQTKDKVAEGRACSNLGIIYQNLSEHEAALKLHKAHLNIAKNLQDRASQGRSYGNIGNAYSSLKQYELAIRYHKQELAISKEVNDRHSEASTFCNLAVAYQALNMHEQAVQNYRLYLNISRELKDTPSEARALCNLGNYHGSRGEFSQAVPFYEQYLILSQELHDVEGEGKACHMLGYAHYSLGNHKEAIRYYEQDLSLAKDVHDRNSMARAYCNLGLAHKALSDYPQALECQKYFLTTVHSLKNLNGKFRALGNLGDVFMKMNSMAEAVKMFNQQLVLAKQLRERNLEATSYANLGLVNKTMAHFDKALGFHTQELTIRQEMNDVKGECRAHGHLGNVHMALGNYSNAYRCYEEQLERSRDLRDSAIEAQACGNLGITKMNMKLFDDAIGLFEQQLAMLEQVLGNNATLDKGRAFGNLGDCYESLRDYEEAVKCYEQFLAIAHNANNLVHQEKAYRGLGKAHRAMGNLQQALVCFEKRLVVTHELDDSAAKSSAYGELGCLHTQLGNFEQAIRCLKNQIQIARDMGDDLGESDAACGLGGVYQQMGDYETALQYHEMDLKLAEKLGSAASQCRAFGNLGLSEESLGNYEKAIRYQEQHLTIAAQMNNRPAKILAYSSLGRVHHAIGNYMQAVQYLQQGLQIAEQLSRKEDEAKIRHRLGLALWGHGDLEEAQYQLYKAAELFENIRREAQINSDYKLSLFDLQTASYQALQRVLVSLGRHEEALVVAERGRTRAFVDLLLERQTGSESFHGNIDNSCVTIEQIQDVIDRQKASVLYYSVAAGYLYSWLIMPHKGIIKFHESSIAEVEAGSDPEDSQSMIFSPTSLLDQYVGHLRESLGLETHTSNLSTSRLSLSRISGMVSETESEADDLWQQHLEEVGDRLNLEQDRSGFLRMVNRNHIMNSSSYSLSSLFSFSGGSVANSIASGTLTRKSSKKLGKAPLGALYELLIGPLEDSLPSSKNSQSVTNDLILVLQGDLYLVPFSVLRSSQTSPCLYERFNLIMVPSIRALQTNIMHNKTSQFNPESTGSLIIGNPKLSSIVTDQWQWTDLPSADAEVKMLAEMLGTKPVTGCFAVKETVMQEMQQVEVVHFATHISWKLSAIVLSSGEMAAGSRTTKTLHGNLEHMEFSDNSSSLSSAFDGPSLSEFLLTAADVLNIKLSAKLVVLSSGHTDDRAGRVNSDGVVGLTRAFLAAGAQCVLFSLWPVAEMASRILLKAFYTGLLQGHRASHALNNAMRTVQNTRQFCHPSNWAGWVLLGSDIKLTSKVALMGHALRELLQTPTKSREAMRVVLHLVEKSLQRIRRGQRNAMYTTEQSVENKVGPVAGWRDLLMSVGFRFEQASNSGSLPAAVFFPTSDPGDRLTQCSASLQALIGLSLDTLLALSKLLANPEAGEALSSLMGEVNTKLLHSKDGDILLPLSVRLWRVPGCHEFLASLGFDLMDVGKDEVTLRAGKQASRRILQFSHQALVALFDTQEAPRMLLLDSSSSMESLTSSGSATSTSNFSKGSSPMGSPKGKRRSIFNPAEVEKLPSASRKKLQDGTLSMTVTATSGKKHYNPNISLQLAHQTDIRTKYSSGSDSANQDDYSQDEATATVVSIETHEAPSQGDCNDIEFSYQKKRYFPKSKPLNTYSTSSTSEGEEVTQTHESDHEDLQRQSRFRSSAASGSSTLTLRSVGSGGLRRNRVRSSAVSIRSSASDRTLKGSNESLSMIGSYEDKGKKVKEPPPPPPVRTVSQVANQPDSDSSLTSLTSTDINASDSSVKNMALDPSTIAQKVLAETHIQREALEKMQRLSLRGHLNLRRIHQKESNSSVTVPGIKPDDAGDSSVSLSKPPATFSSIYSTPRSVHDDIIETQLEKMNNEPAPVIPISPVTMSSSETGDGALSESLTPTISSFLNSPSTELSTDSSHSAFVVCTEKSLSPASHSNSCHDETGFHGESDCRTSAATFQDSGLSSMPTTNCSSSSAGNSSFDSTSSCHVTTISGKERPPVPAKPKILNNKVPMHKQGEEAPQSGSTFSAFHHRPVPVTHTGQHVRFSDQCVTYSSSNNYPPSVSRSYDSNPVPSDSLSVHTAGGSSVRLTRQVVSANRQPSPRASYNNCPPNVESVITSKRFSSSSEDSHWSSELSSLNDSGGGKAQSPSFEMRSFQPYNSKYQQYSTQQLLRKNANMGSHGYGFHSTPQQQRQTMHGANDRELLQGEEHSPLRTKPFHEFPERTTSFCESPDRTKPFCESPERIKPFADLQDGKVTSGQSVLVARIAPSRTNVSTSESSQTKVPVSQVVYRDGERRVIPKNSVLQSSKC